MLEKNATKCLEKDIIDVVDLSVDKSINVKEEVKVVANFLRSLSFAIE